MMNDDNENQNWWKKIYIYKNVYINIYKKIYKNVYIHIYWVLIQVDLFSQHMFLVQQFFIL